MFGEKILELVREVKNTSHLPSYRSDIMTEIRKEMLQLKLDLENTAHHTDNPEYLAYRLALQEYLNRNQRGVFLYLFRRMRMILALVRSGEIDAPRMRQVLETLEVEGDDSADAPISSMEKYYLDKFSRAEKRFLTDYATTCQNFDIEVGLNLTEDRQPPSQLMVEVKALKTLGTKVLINGRQVDIQKDHYYFIPRLEAEAFVNRGEMINVDRR